ncbi:2-oxo acid dehydrogenase subunit E2 [Candidatus Bathyarchaeota archaeon]|nr:2-oxo acid dehydrogenase subunit E2 [Candidatus Bathyarchaeota archaeon]
MVTMVKMPKSDLTMERGTILKWYKREGDKIMKGEPLVQIMAQKSTIDLESSVSGTVLKTLAEENEDVPVGKIIAILGEPGEEIPSLEALEEEARPKALEPILEVSPKLEEVKSHVEVRASPLARKLAKEHGIDLREVEGTGPGGRVTESDVQRYLEAKAALKVEGRKVKESLPVTGLRRIVAERMVISATTAPRITLFMEVDASGIKAFRERLKFFENLQVSYTDILVKAVAKALREHPIMNSTFDGDSIKIFEDVNIGVAVATDMGLVVPVIHNADKLPLSEVSEKIRVLAEKARDNRLERADVSNGTFTITNLGMYDVDTFTPLINPPECAILGVGRIAEKPVVNAGRIEIKPMMTLSLSFDHRIVDGAPASRFMQTLKKIIEGVDLT